MWIDEDGNVHTVYVPPEQVLGQEVVAHLAQIPEPEAEVIVDELDDAYERIEAVVRAEGAAFTGPSDLEEVDEAQIPYPPVLPQLQLQPGVPVATTVLSYVGGLPAQWRLEALEAVIDVLLPEVDEEEVERAFAEIDARAAADDGGPSPE